MKYKSIIGRETEVRCEPVRISISQCRVVKINVSTNLYKK